MKIMLWTDNNTIGGIDPSEGIQLKEIDRQGIMHYFLCFSFNEEYVCCSLKLVMADVIKRGDAGFLGDILRYEVGLIIVKSIVNFLFIYSIHCFRLFINMEEYIVILIV